MSKTLDKLRKQLDVLNKKGCFDNFVFQQRFSHPDIRTYCYEQSAFDALTETLDTLEKELGAKEHAEVSNNYSVHHGPDTEPTSTDTGRN